MSKLFKLKEYLTLDEAAAHISSVLGEPATVADLYRFALEGHLTLSVDFFNQTYARAGKWVKTDEIEFILITHDIFSGEQLAEPDSCPSNYELHISGDDWISLEGAW